MKFIGTTAKCPVCGVSYPVHQGKLDAHNPLYPPLCAGSGTEVEEEE